MVEKKIRQAIESVFKIMKLGDVLKAYDFHDELHRELERNGVDLADMQEEIKRLEDSNFDFEGTIYEQEMEIEALSLEIRDLRLKEQSQERIIEDLYKEKERL